MAVAMLYPDGGKGGRGKKGNPAISTGFSQRRLEQARQVLRYSRELAPRDIAGSVAVFRTLVPR
jgi:hypothetical protein